MKKIAIIALAATILASCEKEGTDMNPSSDAQSITNTHGQKVQVTRPFSINVTTTADLNAPPTECTGDLEGFVTPGQFMAGTASHLGQIDPVLSRLQDISCNLSFTTALLTTHIEGQLVAANGDIVYFEGDDEISIINLLTPNAPPTGTISGTWTITGGTGRFVGASGSFDINGPVSFATTSFSFTGIGTIKY
jgi:hypothetical protein